MAIHTPSVTPRAYPVSAQQARMGTAAGLRQRVEELKAMAAFLDRTDPSEAQHLRAEAAQLEGAKS